MASASPSRGRFLAKVMRDQLDYDDDKDPDDCITMIRCNGREFQVEMSRFFICDSPIAESRYLKFVQALRDDYNSDDERAIDEGEMQHPEEVVEEFHEWLIAALEPVFLEVAPDVPPSFDPVKLANGEARPLLSEYLFPEQHCCRLEIENENLFPILLRDQESDFFARRTYRICPDLAQELQQYVNIFDPSAVEVSFRKPKDALSDKPTRVLVELDGQKTTCFFKSFRLGAYFAFENELEAHLRVLKSSLVPDARLVRLCGIVVVDNGDVAGLLLTYVNKRSENDGVLFLVEDELLHTPIPLRQRWAAQIQETVAQLHEAGVVWGDAKAENVMIDRNDDAWLIFSGGEYTRGWVDKEKAGTKEGDLQGVARSIGHLDNEPYEEREPYSDSDMDWDMESDQD